MNVLRKAFKTELLLTHAQQQKVNQTIGVCRYVYNLYLSTAQEYYKENKKHLSGFDFSKWLNNVHTKKTDKWIKEVSSKAVKQAVMNGDKAFKNFFKGTAGFPRFKKKKNQDVKAYFPKKQPNRFNRRTSPGQNPDHWMGAAKGIWLYSNECGCDKLHGFL